MINNLLRKVVGSKNDREVKRFGKVVAKINGMEAQFESLGDDALRAKTGEFRERLAAGESLDALLPEAFAVVREASKRVMGMRSGTIFSFCSRHSSATQSANASVGSTRRARPGERTCLPSKVIKKKPSSATTATCL